MARLIFLSLLLVSAALAQQCPPDNTRVECFPDPFSSEAKCIQRGCTWCPTEMGVPHCVLPAEHGYNYVSHETSSNGEVYTLRIAPGSISYFGNEFDRIQVGFEFQSASRLRVTIRPENVARYEVPIKIHAPTDTGSRKYAVEHNTDNGVYSFKIKRVSTGSTLLDSSLGGLTISDQFLQLGLKLNSTNMYGIGENEQYSFRHSFEKFATFPVYTRDQHPEGPYVNLYGAYPQFTVLEEDGNAFAVAMLNSNAQEFAVTPAPGIVYRTIGGIIDMYIFLGPTPEETVEQFTEAVGRNPIPPYWSLGFQLARWGYDTIENLQAIINRNIEAEIPIDVQYGDIDIMVEKRDFTVDLDRFHGMTEYVKELKDGGIHFVPIIDPGIPFETLEGRYRALDLGNELDIWIKRPDGTPFVGAVWPGLTYYPDWSKNATVEWMTTILREYRDILEWDSLWIDMNEPSNWGQGDQEQGCANNSINNPPYTGSIRGSLYDGTICADAVQEFGIHYDVHSLFGYKMAETTAKAMHAVSGKRGFVVSRSSFLGHGAHATHWLGDNYPTWENLRVAVIGILQFNQFGVPFVGADLCGHSDNTNPKICQRWMEVGAFYPFCRNHNTAGTIDQDPAVWPEVADASRKALGIRYTLLPYLYTLFFQHRVKGNTVFRALWHEFPQDSATWGNDRQFMWGNALLISPVLEEDAVTVDAYFPGDAPWYSYYNGEQQPTGRHTLDAPLDFIPVHIRAGHVLPTQVPALNTKLSRENPFGLIIALNASGSAQGELFYDDGESIDPEVTGNYYFATFTVGNRALTNSIVKNGYTGMSSKTLDRIRLFGAGNVSKITVNGRNHDDFLLIGESVEIRRLGLSMTSEFAITWSS